MKRLVILTLAVILISNAITGISPVSAQSAPNVATGTATVINQSSATLNGTVNANGVSTNVTFEYGLDTDYGSIVIADQSPVTGSTDTAVNVTISELLPNTTYHYRIKGRNLDGTSYGADMTFTTLPLAPTVVTSVAITIDKSSAVLNGMVNANGASTVVTFEYGLDTNYGSIVTADQSPVTGNMDTAVSIVITGLTKNTTYHYRVVGQNAGGINYGADMSFTTGSGKSGYSKTHGKDNAPGQNKEPGEPANGKAYGKYYAPGQNRMPGEPANGKAYGKDNAPGQNK